MWSVYRVAAVWERALRTQHSSKIWPRNVCNPIAACSGHCNTIASELSVFETTAISWSTMSSQQGIRLTRTSDKCWNGIPEYERRNLEEIDKLATPIINRMATIQPQLSSSLDATTVGWRTYFVCAIFSLLFFAVLVLMSYLFAKYQKIHRCFPFRLTHVGHEIETFPVTAVAPGVYEYLR